MNCCCHLGNTSIERAHARDVHRQIERQLRKDRKRKDIQLLFLGKAGSGKSTLMKQMRITHGGGYSEEEKLVFIKIVYQHVLAAICTLIDAMATLKIAFTDENSQKHVHAIQTLDLKSEILFTQQKVLHLNIIQQLWADGGIQEVYTRRSE